MHEEIIFKGQTQYTPYRYCIKRTISVYSYIQYALCEGFPSSPFHFVCGSEFYRSISRCIRSRLEPLLSHVMHDNNQRSRGGVVMFAYAMWKERIYAHRHVYTLINIKQCIKCIGEKNNRKYRSYQASIDPIPIPTLVSILSIFGSIRTPLLLTRTRTWTLSELFVCTCHCFQTDKVKQDKMNLDKLYIILKV